MRNSLIAVLAVLLAVAPEGRAELFGSLRRTYGAPQVPDISTADSPRLAALLHGGNIYLSLHDMIALAIENNVDVESQRYNPRIADADLLRARAGGLLRGVNTQISQGPNSASASANANGVLQGANVLGGGLTGSSTNQGAFSGITVQGLGSAIPTLDPVLQFNTNWGHTTQPLTSTFVTGTNSLTTDQTVGNFLAQKGFLTGTTVTYGFFNNSFRQNSPQNDVNPATQSSFILDIRQHLLQGFGRAVNGRLITVAKNDRELSDLVFKQQVITTVSAAIGLYYDLITLRDSQKVRQASLDISQKLLADNKTRVSIGALAPIEIVRAEAEVARDQQSLIDAETQVLEQETILKNFLTRSDRDDIELINAHIIPTDPMRPAEVLPAAPIQDLFAEALNSRPEIKQNQISLTNTKESMRGTKNGLLPTLDAYADIENHALSGSVNGIPVPDGSGGFTVRTPGTVDPFFVGGYGRALGQLFGRNFPRQEWT
jgi:outer membrane protein TolC